MVYPLKMGGSFHGKLLVITRWYPSQYPTSQIIPYHNQVLTISVGFLRISIFGGSLSSIFQPGPTGTGRGDAHSGDPTGTMAVAQVKVLFNEPGY